MGWSVVLYPGVGRRVEKIAISDPRSPTPRRGVLLWASCLARRFALNAPCPTDRDWHTRSHTLSLSRQRPRDPRRASCWPLSVGGGGRGAAGGDGGGRRSTPSSRALEEGEPSWYWPVTGASGCLGFGRAEPPGPTAPPPPTRPCTALTWGGGWGEGTGRKSLRDWGPCHPSCQLLPLCNSTDQ